MAGREPRVGAGGPVEHGKGDEEANGEIPEFAFTHGPGTRLTEGEVKELRSKENPQIVHRAHLRRAAYDQFGFNDRCGGCSALLRGLRVQPHADHCRRHVEKRMGEDARVNKREGAAKGEGQQKER